MPKWLVVALFAFAVLVELSAQEVVPTTSTNASDRKGQLNSKQNQETRSPDSASGAQQIQVRSKQEEARAASLDLLYRCYLGATIVGVMGGFIGIALLRRQIVLLRRSVDAANLSAEAAKNSADALINAERPWIVTKITKKVVTPKEGNTNPFSTFRLSMTMENAILAQERASQDFADQEEAQKHTQNHTQSNRPRKR
jgi:hypothetical protein